MPVSAGSLPDWPRSMGRPEVSGELRAVPEDFQVWEQPLIEPQGSGSHLWLEVRKRDANTQWVAGQLASAAGVQPRDVGFAGLKDRHAVTTQWFSLCLQEATDADWSCWEIPGVSILQASLHGRKLQRGALRGNRFLLTVRKLRGSIESLTDRLGQAARTGVPNYFGPQRFGHGGANVERGVRWLARGGRIRRSERSIYLSAVRSYLFNEVLANRVDLGNWNRLVGGDVVMLDGSRSTFCADRLDADLERRCMEFDIHPTGPLPGRARGRRGECAGGDAAALEESILGQHEDLVTALQAAGVDADRRSLRVLPSGLEWQIDDDDLVLGFALPPGAYATSLLRELVLTKAASISESK
jgi:tRNA pseudouridine13 synthase